MAKLRRESAEFRALVGLTAGRAIGPKKEGLNDLPFEASEEARHQVR